MTSYLPRAMRAGVWTAGLICCVAAQAAGSVKIDFKEPDRFSDIGFGHLERERNLRVLSEHMQRWQSRLPDGQELAIEVLNVDLAGEVHPWRLPSDVRVLTGRADWPHMELRWQLKSGQQVLKGGTDRLSDMNYLGHVARLRYPEALSYEVRMLDDWLRERVLASAGR